MEEFLNFEMVIFLLNYLILNIVSLKSIILNFNLYKCILININEF
jgi:hypothetical protein